MKHEITFTFTDPPHFTVLTRVDYVCKTLLENLSRADIGDDEAARFGAILSTYIFGATYIECLTNYLLRKLVRHVIRSKDAQSPFDDVFFEAMERLSTVRKLGMLGELKAPPPGFAAKVRKIRALLDKRNGVIHYKAKPDTFKPSQVVTNPYWLEDWKNIPGAEFVDRLQASTPNQQWVTDLLAENVPGKIAEFVGLGEWLEAAFDLVPKGQAASDQAEASQ